MKTVKIALTLIFILGLCGYAWAEWSTPVPLSEVNTTYSDANPFLSFDGLTLYFNRMDTDTFYYTRIFQATRSVPSGPFTSIQNINELNYSGGHVGTPWVSQDNLRMYYYRTEPGSVWRMKLSERASVSDPWPVGDNISELNAVGNIYSPSLTADELTIFFATQPEYDIWTANRPDKYSAFGNIRSLTEINTTYGDGSPHISSDGLTLHFSSNRNGPSQIFKATRNSLSEPFGNVEHLSLFDRPGGDSGSPNPSYDGTAFYYGSSLTGVPGDIYVSYLDSGSYASNPDPADGAVIEGPDVLLSWEPGIDVTEHDVYMGTSWEDVNDAVYDQINPPPEYLGTATEPSFMVTGLLENTTYYWRVDEVNGRLPLPIGGGTYYTGDVWSFNTGTGGLIAHWKLDEGTGGVAYDSAGDNDGTLINGPIWTTGQISSALEFDGVDDYIEVDDSPNLDGMSALTLAAWVKTEGKTGTLDDNGFVINKYIHGGAELGNSYDIGVMAAGDVRFQYNIGNDIVIKVSTPTVTDDSWHHIVGVYTGSKGSIYIDGVEVSLSRDNPDPCGLVNNTTEPVLIGCAKDIFYDRTAFFNGLIDDVRIYDRALSAGEIEELYNSVPVPPAAKTYHVDGVNGSDLNDGQSRETAFATIQKGIDTATDGNSVLVYPAVYDEALLINNKAIRLQGVATSAGIPIVQKALDYAFSYYVVEGPDSLLKNFVIRGSDLGILIIGGSPTISNVTIVDNVFGLAAYAGATPDISNCIFWNNADGDLFGDPDPIEARYSFVEEEVNEPTIAGLVSHWMFDEGTGSIAYDSAGTNHGAIYGAAWTTGLFGNALNFDGVDDYVEVGDDPSLRFTQYDSFSICSWVNLIESTSSGFIVCKMRASHQSGYFGYNMGHSINSNVYFFTAEKSMQDSVTIKTGEALFGEWTHVTAVYDNKDMKIYLNGVLKDTDTFNLDTGSTSPDKDLAIGARSVDSLIDYHFNGAIDDVRIYNRALSTEEVQQLYQPVVLGDPLFGDDYHLLSERGRHWPEHDVWVLDKVTSPCVDGGDPAIAPSNEPMPNGGRINMGAYGNTAYASMSEWPIEEDNNRDGIVNMIDIAKVAARWLEKLDWVE